MEGSPGHAAPRILGSAGAVVAPLIWTTVYFALSVTFAIPDIIFVTGALTFSERCKR
jgi:hypothetical protein